MSTENSSELNVNSDSFQPRIVSFCCNYCAYAAADLAGSLRLSYPPNIRVVLLPCTGRLDLLEVLHTFERGADAVMVAGCLEGDCHFQEGNLNARRRVEYMQSLLAEIGLEPERIRMFNMSSAMAAAFAEASTEFTVAIQSLGPSPLGKQPVAEAEASEPEVAAVAT
ncbi:MAG: hydrogenase iron-sulfur subunit [Chloroflexota bacterium]|nr:hydrogenase iron-sulfur subunit [Chloroflexota bacterium]